MKENISIRRGVPGDEQSFALLGQATFLESLAGFVPRADILHHCDHQHSVGLYREWLADPGIQLWIAEIEPGGAPVGYLVMKTAQAENGELAMHIERIYLLHRFQGNGLGRRLMDAAVAHSREAGAQRTQLCVYVENKGGIAFYLRYGYTIEGSRMYQVHGVDYENHLMYFRF